MLYGLVPFLFSALLVWVMSHDGPLWSIAVPLVLVLALLFDFAVGSVIAGDL